jgi:hypothetical protein
MASQPRRPRLETSPRESLQTRIVLNCLKLKMSESNRMIQRNVYCKMDECVCSQVYNRATFLSLLLTDVLNNDLYA